MRGECDLEETCDGVTHTCPRDVHKVKNKNGTLTTNTYYGTIYLQATGSLCEGGGGHCHSGSCGSLGAQCRLLWGEQARVAHSSCFSLNRRGDTRGNCGYKDTNRTHFRSCAHEDIMCGLLHCQVRIVLSP